MTKEGITCREKGKRLEEDIYEQMKNIFPTQRISDGYWSNRKNKYIPTGDGGIDLVTETQKLLIYIQCKNWEAKAGTATVREFIGGLEKFKNQKKDKKVVGIMIAKSGYTEGALNEIKAINTTMILTTTEEFKEIKTKEQLLTIIEKAEKETYKEPETTEETKNYSIIEKRNKLIITWKK
jgi:restriction endonuclease Mrr